MKKFTTILLLVIILLQTFSSLVIKAEYLINKGYIARVLCINKDKPAMHCNGKCYLARQLKEQESREQQAPLPKKEKFEVQPCFLPHRFSITGAHLLEKTAYHTQDEPVYSIPLRTPFHPPSV